jgi:serine phosphatase RsbU (regulator of sigma subunit)/PAS domain-containing protein
VVPLPLTCSLPPSPDEAFDRFTRLVQAQLDVPIALACLVSRSGQVFPGAGGLGEPWQSRRSGPLAFSPCRHVVDSGRALVVNDTGHDQRTRDTLAVRDLGVRGYAGFPLVDADGDAVGCLSAMDTHPRTWSRVELTLLGDLATVCSSVLQLRRAQDAARRSERHSQALLELSEALSPTITVQEVEQTVARVAVERFGASYSGVALIQPKGRILRYVRPDTLPGATANRWREFSLDAHVPSAVVARTGRELVYRDSGQVVVDFPQLANEPTRSLTEGAAIFPLVVASRVVGSIMLSWAEPHEVDYAEREVLAALARYTAQAIGRAQLLQERHEVAETLQRSMLSELPALPGLELAATYLAASAGERVGGDWYDAVPLSDGAIALAIGDVTGHDMAAAAAMGQLHTLLRAFVYDRHGSPSRIVARLDRTIRGLRIDAVATALLARLEPAEPGGDRLMRWSSAGHLPPALLLPDGSARQLGPQPDLLLGIDPSTPRHDHSCRLPPGATLVLFTDGLVENAGTGPGEGVQRLLGVLAEHAGTPLDHLPELLVGSLVRGRSRDDCAVLAVRLPVPSPSPGPA